MLLRKRGATKRCFALILTFLLIATTAFGNVFSGKLSEVQAGGRTGSYGIYEKTGADKGVPNYDGVFDDDYFNSDGSLTLEFKAKDNEYELIYQDETNKKLYINKNFYAIKTEYNPISYFIINGKKLVKNNGQSITIYKTDFTENSNAASTYGNGFKDLFIDYITTGILNQWYKGFWIDGNGENSYSPLGYWKGSGDSQWFEDSSGWYPVSQWMKADKYYKSADAKINRSDASQMGGSWGENHLDVSSAWFYFDSNGYAASNGWYQIDGYWYHFDNFLYEANCWRDGYYIGYDGTQTYEYTGSWKSDGTGWWFEDTSGWYPSNQSQIINGETYYFKADGYLATDQWLAPGDGNNPGEAGNGWDSWIHVDSSGVQDKWGRYDSNGEWVEFDFN